MRLCSVRTGAERTESRAGGVGRGGGGRRHGWDENQWRRQGDWDILWGWVRKVIHQRQIRTGRCLAHG